MQYSCVAFILLSPVVMLGFNATVEIDYLNWKLIDEPEIGEPLIYHFIGPLSSYICPLIDISRFLTSTKVVLLSTLAFIFTNFHLWNDRSVRYALERNLFATPGYRAFNTGVEHILNRLTRDNLISDDDNKQTQTYTFICTTLWHETELELETLLSQGS